MLRIEHLTKKYGDKTAVDDLNLHIQSGEIYGFICCFSYLWILRLLSHHDICMIY